MSREQSTGGWYGGKGKGGKGGPPRWQPYRQRVCWQCGESGHVSWECPRAFQQNRQSGYDQQQSHASAYEQGKGGKGGKGRQW